MLSAGALLDNEDLIDVARKNGGQIVVPTGALIGLDAVTAAAVGDIHSVRMVTRKPVQGLAGAPFLVENNIDIENIKEPLKIFDGTAREAAKGFPANLNVAVALSLAGIGPDRTRLEIWADPALDAQRASRRGRFRRGAVFDVDREYPVRKSQDRAHHRVVGDRAAPKTAGGVARRDLTESGRKVAAMDDDAENVASGTWLYDRQVPRPISIMRKPAKWAHSRYEEADQWEKDTYCSDTMKADPFQGQKTASFIFAP